MEISVSATSNYSNLIIKVRISFINEEFVLCHSEIWVKIFHKVYYLVLNISYFHLFVVNILYLGEIISKNLILGLK